MCSNLTIKTKDWSVISGSYKNKIKIQYAFKNTRVKLGLWSVLTIKTQD